jgi:NTP pyrophosphatase (non-canonical NTP hydrolase)
MGEEVMKFQEYQQLSRETAQYPVLGHVIVFPALGLSEEAGEVAGKVKKLMRDQGGVITMELREALAKELGDVLWYLTQVATEANLDLASIAQMNLAKLQDRKARGVISGEGDDR